MLQSDKDIHRPQRALDLVAPVVGRLDVLVRDEPIDVPVTQLRRDVDCELLLDREVADETRMQSDFQMASML